MPFHTTCVETKPLSGALGRLHAQVCGVLVGKEEVVRRTLVSLLARGHLLIEDVPGIGKTLLGLALARSIDAKFRRIQFTNDLLPADILGLHLYDQKTGRFDFRPGPVFANVLLADEINRSTPKTQSALLEAMNERQVSLEGSTFPLPDPFFVIATENPVEHAGTFPLPEAQLDRFLMRVQIGYPDAAGELEVLRGGEIAARLEALKPVMSLEEVKELQLKAAAVHADDAVLGYAVAIARATREDPRIRLGLSPRGTQALASAAKATALLEGRDFVIPDDVKRVAGPAAAHRIMLDGSPFGLARVAESERLVESVLSKVPAPG
ncbi:MAG: AAA family ATPase [Elusimicrobia bacterium]|nr:AAA family ATPase [Elusimicrobiota bacterium]